MAESKYSKLCDRIGEILGTPMSVEQKNNVPKNTATIYNKAYEVRLGAVFVDMRDSKSRFSAANKELVAKTAKSFDGTVLRMLRAENCVEIGVRGNTVFAIYSVRDDLDTKDLIGIAAKVNSAVRLLNILYAQRNMDPVFVGIGVSVSSGLVMKARCKMLGDRDRIWIADCISEAIELSKMGGVQTEKGRTDPVALCPLAFTFLRNNLLSEDTLVVRPFSRNESGFVGDIRSRELEDWIDGHFFR